MYIDAVCVVKYAGKRKFTDDKNWYDGQNRGTPEDDHSRFLWR